jgi:hypothetical protein
MINIISSSAVSPSSALSESPRKDDEDNLQWIIRNMPLVGEQTNLVMVGGTGPASFRLRVAQSHIRHDLEPSYWSHVMMLGKQSKNPGSTTVYEISLEASTFGFPPPENGVQTGRLSQYRDPKMYPNIAILAVPIPQKEVMEALDRFKMQRAVLDAVDLIVRWLSYVWGVSRGGNPILEGQGIPSAAMLEIVFGATGYDLTPGLESRSSCPEAIWQAAKWWHKYYEGQNRSPLTGVYYVGHRL